MMADGTRLGVEVGFGVVLTWEQRKQLTGDGGFELPEALTDLGLQLRSAGPSFDQGTYWMLVVTESCHNASGKPIRMKGDQMRVMSKSTKKYRDLFEKAGKRTGARLDTPGWLFAGRY